MGKGDDGCRVPTVRRSGNGETAVGGFVGNSIGSVGGKSVIGCCWFLGLRSEDRALAGAACTENEESDDGQYGDDDENEQRDEEIDHRWCQSRGLRNSIIAVALTD